jgi:hypothetical protein
MQQGFLNNDQKKPSTKDGNGRGLGPLQDRRSLPPTYGGRSPGMSWGSSNSNIMGDSLGKAASDWKLPPASASEASPDKGVIWKSPAPSLACTADSSTVTTWAATISTTDSVKQEMSASTTTTKFASSVHGMVHDQPETVSVQTEMTATSISGGGSHNNNSNPYKGISFKLNKTSGVPKAALHSVYGRPPRRKVISQENYHTWHNSGPPHLLKFTSIFCCPLTGECFASGRYGDPKFYYQHASATNSSGSFVTWYNKKALAEHGAAARAFDCIAYRECAAAGNEGMDMIPETLGADAPYAYEQSPPLVASVPDNIRQAIREAQQGIFNNSNSNHSQGGDGSTKMEVESAIDKDEESAWFSRPLDDAQTSKDLFG